MSPQLRIVLSAAPTGPWSILAAAFEAEGVDLIIAPQDVTAFALPEDWRPDALVVLPEIYQEARFDELDLDLWNSTNDIEITRRFTLAQTCARAMAGQGGVIVHVTDRAALIGDATAGASLISAFSAAGLSRGAALDLRDRVRSNVVATCATEPDVRAFVAFVRHLTSESGKSISGQIVSITAERVQLFSQPRPIRVAHSDGPWNEHSLIEQVSEWVGGYPRPTQGAKA